MISEQSKAISTTDEYAKHEKTRRYPRCKYIYCYIVVRRCYDAFLYTRTTKELEMNDEMFRRCLFGLTGTRPGFRVMHWDVRGRIILAKPRTRVLGVINNAGFIVLVLSDVRILHFQVGMSVDLTHDGRLNNGLRGGCEDLAVRVDWGVVSGGRGHRHLSEWDVYRVAGECAIVIGREGIVDIRPVGQRRRRTIYVHDWHMLDERRRACAR